MAKGQRAKAQTEGLGQADTRRGLPIDLTAPTEHSWGMSTRDVERTNQRAAKKPEQLRQAFFEMANRHLQELYDFVRHALAAYQAAGDVMPGELGVEDVVDEVFLHAYRESVRHPRESVTASWLTQLARERLDAEVRRLKVERESAEQIEEDIPETSPTEEPSTLGEEILYHDQPAEDLKLEDVVPDFRIPPPAMEEDAERALRICVDVALAELPRLWRRALVLRYVRGLRDEQLARAMHRPKRDVERIVELARALLRQRMVESGCVQEDRRGGGVSPNRPQGDTTR
jgi:RNA polymerase sigma factor (sigma-70 family)